MNKKERYKKLIRKLKHALRSGEDYLQFVDELDRLDAYLASTEPATWVVGGHHGIIAKKTGKR